ncbi:unnamed protein product, partial [Didymodactylos carnosus]
GKLYPSTPRTVTQTNIKSLRQVKSKRSFKFSRPKWMTKRFLIIAGVISCIVIIAAIVIPIAVIFRRGTSATVTTTTAPTLVVAYWGFDQNAYELYGNYNGTTNCGSCQYSTTSYFGGYFFYVYGVGYYMQVPATSYFNLNSRSFTFEAWIYLQSLSVGDQPIFSQCTCTTCSNQCLVLMIRSSKLFMTFTYNDLSGTTTLATGTWYRVTFVYNYYTYQQIIYIDGVQDAVRTSSSHYLGTNGSMYFGYSPQLPSNYYYGFIDSVTLSSTAKTSTQVLNDATVIFYYSFDQPSPYYDNGPYHLNYTSANNLAITSGKSGQAIRSTSTSSYLTICCWGTIGYPTTRSLSAAIWFNPSSINGGVFVYSQNGINLLGLTYSGQIIAQIYAYQPVQTYYPIIGSFATISTWTHVAFTFSVTNGLILYINGVAQGSITGITQYYWASNQVSLQLGYGNGNQYGYIPGYGFQGTLDEFYIYRRELSSSDVLTLASI